MKTIKLLLVVAAILAIAGIFMPQDYNVSRTLVITAPLAAVQGHVEDMDNWNRWTVWDEVPPPAGGQLARMESGVGSGKYLSGNSGSGWLFYPSGHILKKWIRQYRLSKRKLKNLKKLTLSSNKIESLPAEIGQLESLEKLDLSKNKLTELPPKIQQLKKLKHLNLKKNNISPEEITKIKSWLPKTKIKK